VGQGPNRLIYSSGVFKPPSHSPRNAEKSDKQKFVLQNIFCSVLELPLNDRHIRGYITEENYDIAPFAAF
jgi:hypothetical protein